MTEPPSTALLAKIVLPDRVVAPAGHVVVSRASGTDRSGAEHLDLYPQERGDADEIYSRLTILPAAGSPAVRIVLTDGAAFEGPLRDVAVQQGLHGVAFTLELRPCRTSGPDPSAVAEVSLDPPLDPALDPAQRHLAEALRPFVTLWAASEADTDDETLDGSGRPGGPGRDGAVRIGHLRTLVEAAIEAGFVDGSGPGRLADARPDGAAAVARTGNGGPATPAPDAPVPDAGAERSAGAPPPTTATASVTSARPAMGAMGATRATRATTLAFRTPPGGVSIPAGTSRRLGTVDVAAFERIRVVAVERAGAGSGARIRLTITEGTELIAPLDVLVLEPMSQVSRVHDVPGTTLTIFADALPGDGHEAVDVLVYGWS